MKIHLKLFATFLLAMMIVSCAKSHKETAVLSLFPVRNGTAFRYIDSQGKTVIPPQFKQATVFREGLALVQVFGSKPMWGFIKADGTFTIKAVYKEATVFSEELAWVVSDNGAPKAINIKGDSLFSLKVAKSVRIFKNGLAAFSVTVDSVNLKWGFVDTKGVVVIAPQFSIVGNFSDGICAVANIAGEWGYINAQGKIIIDYQFTNAKEFVGGKAIVQSGKEWGVIDEKGKFVINPQFTEMRADNDQYIIQQNNKWGWCDRSGQITIESKYTEALPFNSYELAPVKTTEKFGYINRKGKLIIDAQFEAALPFNGKIAWIMMNGKGGFIDKDAKFVVQPHYDAISDDLKAFLIDGSSTFESVTTDYFDVEAIVNRLKEDISENSVAGMNFIVPMPFVFKKYNKKETDFIRNATEHKIITAERISNDATLDFFILGTPWAETYNGKLGFSYALKPNYKHSGFSYRINLSTNGTGKEDVVLKSIDKAFIGYTKEEKYSNNDVIIFKNKYQLIVCLRQTGNVIIAIYPLTSENLQMINLNYGDGTEQDSTIVATDSVAVK